MTSPISQFKIHLPKTLNAIRCPEWVFNRSSAVFGALGNSFRLLLADSSLPTVLICILILSSCSSISDPPPPPNRPDTTSHDFTWQIDTLGDGNSSVLYDVAIIDENNIWAVGELFLADSSATIDPVAYNLARWNGNEWVIERLMFPTCDNGVEVGLAPYRCVAIWSFGPNDLWLATGGPFIHWDGTTFERICLPNSLFVGANQKIWGSSSQGLYAVGTNGQILHFDGSTWSRVESGTTLPFQDVWGDWNEASGAYEIIAVASDLNQTLPTRLFRLSGSTSIEINSEGLSWGMSSIWFESWVAYYVVGNGMFESGNLSESWNLSPGDPPYVQNSIRGNGANDVFTCGALGYVGHFNGSSWKSYVGGELPGINGRYRSIAMRGKLVVIVGWVDNRAIVLRGIRN